MKLKYKARTKEGELQMGHVEAATREAAINTLVGHNLFILSLEEVKHERWYDAVIAFFNRVKTKDLMIFTRQFATLMSAEIPLSDALRTLQRQTRNAALRETMFEVASDIDAGLSLSQALEKYGDVFSAFYVNMVRSAEVTGRVEEAVNFLADYIERQAAIASKIRNALIYPLIMVVLFFLVAGVMSAVVLPNIEPVFREAGVDLPFSTRILLAGGAFLATWWWAVLLVLGVCIAMVVDYFRTPEGKVVFDELLFRTPVFGSLMKQMYVARFAESVSILIQGGIPIAQAMEISGHTIGSLIYRDMLHQTAEDIRRGELLSQSLSRKEELFPPLVSQMVAIGEQTGRLDELLKRIAAFYTREVDSVVDNLVELIQPILMLVIGILVGGLFFSILKPIYSLVQTF